MKNEAPQYRGLGIQGMSQGEIMQGISVKEMFGRRSLIWVAQATGIVWKQDGLRWKWQNEARGEPGANQISRKYKKDFS